MVRRRHVAVRCWCSIRCGLFGVVGGVRTLARRAPDDAVSVPRRPAVATSGPSGRGSLEEIVRGTLHGETHLCLGY